MDPISAEDLALQAVLGRGGDFVGGIDNEALDFSQLEAFINSDGSQSNANYFGESLNSAAAQAQQQQAQPQQQSPQQPQTQSAGGGKQLLNVIVENKRTPGHSLPESPPDSSSEHPYSPSETCEPQLAATADTIYTTLGGQSIYKQNSHLLNPIIADNIILGSHIVVAADQSGETQRLLENAALLQQHQDARILVERTDGGALLADSMLLADEQSFDRRSASEILLVKNGSAADDEYDKNLLHLGFASQTLDVQMPQQQQQRSLDEGMEGIQAVYTNLQNAPKKRKLSQDLIVKSEPEHCSPGRLSPPATTNVNSSLDDDYAASESCLSDSQYQCIRFQPFQQSGWHSLCDQNLTELPSPHYRVDADKGFNFSNADDAFVCQKKNHFQITCHVQLLGDAQFVKTSDGFQKIASFHLHFYGVKHDCPTQTIRVEQSQSDRSKKPFHPVLVELVNSQVTKVTVGRLHFSETTSNNMRKKGKPNPEQRYFQLVVGLHAHTTHGNFPIVSHASQKIIVRASNPGQFESDVELCWQKGQTQDSIFHAGKVGVNTDRPDESLVIHGNLKITGHIIQPSDVRAKKNIVECSTAEQLRNVQKLRVVRYEYEPGFASQLNRITGCSDTGVIAQEVAEILPEAVRPAGNLLLDDGTSIDDFLVVNKERIFMENVGAVKELCKVTDNLETRIDQLERINRRYGYPAVGKFKRVDSLKSNSTANSIKRMHSKTCTKSRDCPDGSTELCSNKFIQVVIVVLVLVMAFCLAAITALYLMETSRHQQLTQANLQSAQRSLLTTHRPTKGPKARSWQTTTATASATRAVRPSTARSSRRRPPPERGSTSATPRILGKPGDCAAVDEDVEAPNLCPVYCCEPPKPEESNSVVDLPSPPLFADGQKPTHVVVAKNKTAGGLQLSVDKNKIVKPFYTNNIDKSRQRRDADDWHDKDNSYDVTDDFQFTIVLQGRSFNTTLTDVYLSPHSTADNYSYVIPISKYMPDEYLHIVFRSSQAHLKDIEHCYNGHKQQECPLTATALGYGENKTQVPSRKVNENVPTQAINSNSVAFEVDMVGFQSKMVTYRASLKRNQNKCKLLPTKLGIEFTEYNFHVYRHCDD